MLTALLAGCDAAATSSGAPLYIGTGTSSINRNLFTQEELEWIDTHQNADFYVGTAQDYVPIEYIDKHGVPRGMGIELIKKVHELTGLKFRFYEQSRVESWEEIMTSLREERVDILSTVSYTQERAGYLEFSSPYIEMTQVWVGNKNTSRLVKDFSQAENATFAVPKGYWFLDVILQELPHAKVMEVSSMEEALQAVSDQKADYTICEIPVFTYYKEQGFYHNIKIVGELEEKNRIFVGVRKELQALIPIVDKVIRNTNYYNEIYESSMVIPLNQEREKKLTATIVVLAAALLVVAYYLFVTFRKLLKSKKEAEKANRDKTKLMINISHDLRTPITVMIGYTQALMEGQVQNSEDKEKYMRRIFEKTKYLSAIVDDFFLLSRLEEQNLVVTKEDTRLDWLIAQIVEGDMMNALEKNIQLTLHIDEKAAVTKSVDRIKLHRAIENIIVNAIHYTGPGGAVQVSLMPDFQDGKVRIAVKDNGAGIPAEDLPYIFERYYKGRNARAESIGLGLYIAREIIHKHGGELRAESEAGRGSSFFIVL
ncbi:MAG: histidine kinase [Paenibacillaceae bacterium]|jgi:signal transduction histidine kinase|nr:histidine kinase [Paenibacillaceae bacterium]